MASLLSYTISVPAKDDSLLVVRLAASGVAAQLKVDVETLEDLKTAVHEACYALLHQRFAPETIEVELTISAGFSAKVCACGERKRTQERAGDCGLCKAVLDTIIDEVSIEEDELGIRSIFMRHCV